MNELDLIQTIPVPKEAPFLEKSDRLVCFGDSLTFDPAGYVFYLKHALEPKGIEIVNAGVSGDKTPTALPRLFKDVIERKPTALSIFFGTNDAVHGHGQWANEPRIAWQTLRDNLEAVSKVILSCR